MHQGKLLALDLLTHVFQDPGHNWSLARPQVRCAAQDFSCMSRLLRALRPAK